MRKPKNESVRSAFVKDGRLKWMHINSNAIPKKESEPIGRTSTPRTSRSCLNGLIIPTEPKVVMPESEMKSLEEYKKAAVELLWRYKALKVINQKLRSRLIALESKILETPMDKISSIIPSTSIDESGRLTYEAGRWKTSKNT